MYEIAVEARFTAAHRHPLPGGNEPGLHGHDFRVVLRLEGPELDADVLIDFHAVEQRLAVVLRELGYQDLSSHADFAHQAATPAALAHWIHARMGVPLAAAGPVRLSAVEVHDSEATAAIYRPD